jgi:hypothetical protein
MHTVKNDTIEIEAKSNESIVEFSENVLNVIHNNIAKILG